MMRTRLGNFLLLLAGVVAVENDWYSRYDHYPPYCSTPEEVAKRKVPKLMDDARLGETRLHHVTAILRHGARTPWGPNLNCWEEYHTNVATGKWDCNLTAYLSPPPPERVSEEGDEKAGSDYAMFLFEKRYDALQSPENNLSNYLNGTCQLGQLLLRGYEQELANGRFIRAAYAYDENKFDHDQRMRLLNIADNRHVWNDVYYRVDDEARTLMSGQVVLRGLMGKEMDAFVSKEKRYPVIPLHTADFARDIVDPNEAICPRLTEIKEQNQQGKDFQAFNQSKEAQLLREFQRSVLRIPNPSKDMDAIDCLMTTICTDRPLPNSIDDYGGSKRRRQSSDNSPYGENLFQRLYEFEVEGYTKNIKANDAAYSKLSLGPLWYEIMRQIRPHMEEGHDEKSLVKLSVFSGHDTTIMPVLAALDPNLWEDKEWPPYASMVLLELHDINFDSLTDKSIFPSDFAFRLIYNGNVITQKITGCPDDLDLCDIHILLDRVNEFARLDQACQREHEVPSEYQGAVERTKDILSTTGGIVYFLVQVVGSSAAGGVAVYVYLTGSLPSIRHQAVETMEDDGIALNGMSREYAPSYHDDGSANDESFTID